MSPKQLSHFFLYKSKVLKYINFQVRAEFSDKKYTIPLVNNVGLRNLQYNTEPWMKDLIAKFLKSKNGIFLDVGANIGQTLMKLRSVSAVPYIGMEPNPECVIYLEKLIKVNKLKDCTICPVGLSNRNGLVVFYNSFEGSPLGTMVEGYNVQHNLYRTQIVSVLRGDDLIPGTFPVKDIAIIKIDVEGAELEVIEGMERILNDYRPYVICEIVPIMKEEDHNKEFRQERIDRLISRMKMHNYAMFRVDEQKKNSYEPISELAMYKGVSVNYAFVPNERADEFISSSNSQ
jgi:FkbM family methyltransferase